MARITKDPETRRNELLDAAEDLFIKEGYEQTSVSDIVKRVNVAQGTFYYYFKSKEEILKSVIDRIFEEARKEIGGLAESAERDSLTRLRAIIQVVFDLKNRREDFFTYIHEDRNALLHQKLVGKLMDILIPVFTRILEEGGREGVFTARYPRETAVLLLSIIGYLYDSPNEGGDGEAMIPAVNEMMERALGLPPGTIQIRI